MRRDEKGMIGREIGVVGRGNNEWEEETSSIINYHYHNIYRYISIHLVPNVESAGPGATRMPRVGGSSVRIQLVRQHTLRDEDASKTHER